MPKPKGKWISQDTIDFAGKKFPEVIASHNKLFEENKKLRGERDEAVELLGVCQYHLNHSPEPYGDCWRMIERFLAKLGGKDAKP